MAKVAPWEVVYIVLFASGHDTADRVTSFEVDEEPATSLKMAALTHAQIVANVSKTYIEHGMELKLVSGCRRIVQNECFEKDKRSRDNGEKCISYRSSHFYADL